MKNLSIFIIILAIYLTANLQTAFAFGNYTFNDTSYYNSVGTWTSNYSGSAGTYGVYMFNDNYRAPISNNYNNSNVDQIYNSDYYLNYPNQNPMTQRSIYQPMTCEATVTRTLSFGMRGTDVATVQDYLHDQDFLEATPNGYFGYNTKYAVMKFQRAYDISSTGTVGPQTRSILNNLICGGDSSTRGRPASATISPVTEIAPTRIQSVVVPYVDQTKYTQGVPTQPSSIYLNSSNPISSGSYVGNSASGSLYNPVADLYYKNQNERATLTVTVPTKKMQYSEGNTMNISWVATNMIPVRYVVTLDNTSTGLIKQIGVFSGGETSMSIVLTKELLDTICAGSSACSAENANSFRVSVTAYSTSVPSGDFNIKAYVDQITIIRPYATQSLSITASKTPINSGETINLYVSVPSNARIFSQHSSLYWRIHSICPSGVAILVNGSVCGIDSYAYQANITTLPNITATLVNNSWGPQQVTFEATAYDFYGGKELGKAMTTIVVNK